MQCDWIIGMQCIREISPKIKEIFRYISSTCISELLLSQLLEANLISRNLIQDYCQQIPLNLA